VAQAVNSEVVDLPILYNFGKGHGVFFSTIFAQIWCQIGSFLHFKPEMPLNMKVVSLDKKHNFCIGRILSG
jgi:hypothetical protein